ncbi:MAG TPA: DEAD/DEAH box helicase, partial [Kofleriaceae bacterium]|nr:DEAD/DEAH box helicase [Kofleriaceae bacterium]
MTNDTTPTENGAADVAMLAAIQNDTTTASTSDSSAEAAQAEAAEPKPPSFDDMGLHPDVKQALDDMGYFAPTPVQTAVFGPVSAGKDLLVQSRTGTGKTTAFGLPLVNRLVPAHRQPQALILAPTRELALQVARELTQIGKHRGILVEAVYGGAPIGKQIKALKDGVHIIVGTPGRVLDHIGRRTLDCKTISTFVLDECDEMLSMGFLEDIERVTQHLPEKHQTLLFSATMPDEVTRYSRRHMTAPEQISLSRDSVSVSDIHHAYYIVSGIARSRDLLKIIFAEDPESAIVFCNMRDETTMVAKFLQKQGLDAEPLSSDLSQSERERVMGRMKAKNLRFLVATDVAARGIDISNLSHVINFTVPESPEVYVHRTGRTGRAGKKGTAISLVGPRELGNFRYVRLQYGIKPEERVLPKDDIFIGKLKVPLPPVGVPQPPDPVQILIRGVQGQPSDLERQIFEKLLAKSDGKRVLAALVAEKLNQLSTKTSRPRRERPERGEGEAGEERGERGERGERRFDRDRGERPRFGDREERGERGERGERRFDRDRGERPRFGDRE